MLECLELVSFHFQACSKVFKATEYNVLCGQIFSPNFVVNAFRTPYLFGVCISQHAIITSFHGFDSASVTLHHVITRKIVTLSLSHIAGFSKIMIIALTVFPKEHGA